MWQQVSHVCPCPSIVYEAIFLGSILFRAVMRLAAAVTKILAMLILARQLIFIVFRTCSSVYFSFRAVLGLVTEC